MSQSAIKPYFRSILNSLNMSEWVEPFDTQNIPRTIIDGSYNIRIGVFSGAARSNVDQSLETDVTVRMFFKGFREPDTAISDAILKTEPLIASILNPIAFQGWSPKIHGLEFARGEYLPYQDEQNDNVVEANLTFVVRTFLCVN